MYFTDGYLMPIALGRRLRATKYDVLYLNSCFSVPFVIVPLLLRRLGLVPRTPVVIGPRGELAPGALATKSTRKRVYIALARILGLTRGAVWQASGQHEAADIRRNFGPAAKIVTVPDLLVVTPSSGGRRQDKKPGRLRLLFFSRISRMKNLDGAIRMLAGVEGSIELSIHGPIEDADYWRSCQVLLGKLPSNIESHYGGAVQPGAVSELMQAHDLLFLPTLGEAFGHVVVEALANGCPVLISDRTRWRDLHDFGVGWDIALEQTERFREVLRHCVSMSAQEWRAMSDRASQFGAGYLLESDAEQKHRELFRAVLQQNGA
jgi:glycosyltransferase involved in cell wall biosynthesis